MKRLPIIIGLSGSLLLGSLYFLFLVLIGGIEHAIGFLQSLWIWLSIIITGFGIQLGLYTYIRQKIKSRAAAAEVSATMGISTGSMIACCLHLALDLLPVLGLSAATIFLTAYQTPILLIGVFSNIIGVVLMISTIKKHNLYNENSIMAKLPKINFRFVLISLLVIGFVTVISAALFSESTNNVVELNEQSQTVNKVTFSIKPEIVLDDSIKFHISMNTHSVDLNFNMTEIAYLTIGDKLKIYPESWTGSTGGGHHREGFLTFQSDSGNIDELVFSLKPSGSRFQEMLFKWKVQ